MNTLERTTSRRSGLARSRPRLWPAFVLAALALALALAVPARPARADIVFTDVNPNNSSLDASDPDGATGGRVNGLATVPGNANAYYAATELGGLYRTTDRGVNWTYLPGHLPQITKDVEVDPSNANRVYATSYYDGRVNSIAGINVSTDGGTTWTHPATANAPAGFCAAANVQEPSAFRISIRPDASSNVFIGTNCGLARSTDSGVTWTYINPYAPTALAGNIYGVLALAGGTIHVCGDQGYRRSTDNGATWTASTSNPLPVSNNAGTGGECSLAVSPDESYVLFAVVGTALFESDNNGASWPNTFTNPGPQGRIPFAVTNQRANNGMTNVFDLWLGDVSLWRASCTTPNPPAQGGARRCPANTWSAGFTRAAGGHDDTADLVFDGAAVDACPAIMASDGGVYRNTTVASPGCQSPTWEQPNVTPHALWLFSMSGADRAGNAPEDLYFGTQDNGSFGTTNAGAAAPTWTNERCCDVTSIVGDANRVVYIICCGFSIRMGNAGLTGVSGIPTNPPGGFVGFSTMPTIARIANQQYAILTTTGLFFTTDITQNPITWTAIAGAPANACSVQVAFNAGTPTFFVQAGSCDRRTGDQLWRHTGTGATAWTQIDNTNGQTGGIGVFAVDPNNPNRLYASNLAAAGPRMVFSTDSGLTWTNDPELDTLMTANGLFRYRSQVGEFMTRGNSFVQFNRFIGYVQPTLLAFDPADGNVIVAGGADSGVFLSKNGGADWRLLTDPINQAASGKPHLSRPSYAYFDHEPADTINIYVGTQGRGVWRIAVRDQADLTTTKTCSGPQDPIVFGQTLTCTITVTNSGTEAAAVPPGAVLVRDTFTQSQNGTFIPTGVGPAGYTCANTPGPVLATDITVTCTATVADSIPPAGTRVFTITGTVTALGGTITNKAIANPNNSVPESNTGNNESVTVTTNVLPVLGAQLVRACVARPVPPGKFLRVISAGATVPAITGNCLPTERRVDWAAVIVAAEPIKVHACAGLPLGREMRIATIDGTTTPNCLTTERTIDWSRTTTGNGAVTLRACFPGIATGGLVRVAGLGPGAGNCLASEKQVEWQVVAQP